MKPTLCQIDDLGRLFLPEDVTRELQADGFRTAVLSNGREGQNLHFYEDEIARQIWAGTKSMDDYREVFQALAGLPEDARPQHPPFNPRLCRVDDQGWLPLPGDIITELQASGLRTAIMSGGEDGYHLAFFPDEIAARAFAFAIEDMSARPEVYGALARS